MKIVQFGDGTYGIRRWKIWGYEFLDLKNPQFFWKMNSYSFAYCKEKNIKVVTDVLKGMQYRVLPWGDVEARLNEEDIDE